jgi:hypothetical protein
LKEQVVLLVLRDHHHHHHHPPLDHLEKHVDLETPLATIKEGVPD